MATPQTEGSIHISSIAIQIREKFGKPVHLITFQTKAESFTKEIAREFPPGHTHDERFDPPAKLPVRDKLYVTLHYRTYGVARNVRISVLQSEIIERARSDADGKETYVTFYHNIVVTIRFSRLEAAPIPGGVRPSTPDVPPPPTINRNPSVVQPPPNKGKDLDVVLSPPTTNPSTNSPPLTPITSEILRVCPRFRLLIIGNSGVGKTSLVHNVFGVKDVDVSAASRGMADIDREFIAPENKLFVVHDSLGLEAAEGNHLNLVKKFISGRRQQTDLKDRLHAVWVCIQVPYAKGRVLEAGMEEFLRKKKEILGDIPVVVVLTKLDFLDNLLMTDLRKAGVKFKSIQEAKPYLKPKRTAFLEEFCGKPILRVGGSDVRYVAVSTKRGYELESTIYELVRTTTSEIARYITADPSLNMGSEQSKIERIAPQIVAGMAQRVSIEVKVDSSIRIWKKKYWTHFGANFTPRGANDFLLVLHQDIVQAWGFDDPGNALHNDGFKEALLDASNLEEEHLSSGGVGDLVAPAISTLAPLINYLRAVGNEPPTTRVDATAKQEPRKVTKTHFVAYIADLIYVMKILSILSSEGTISSRDVTLALEVYKRSSYRHRVHAELEGFSAGLILPGRTNEVAEKIQTLIRRYISDDEVLSLRSQIPMAPGL